MKRFVRDTRGFTLAELLIVVAILGFMMGALFTLQRQGQLAYLTGSARVEVQQNARFALDMMISDIRSALPVGATSQVVTAIDANCATGAPPTNGSSLSLLPSVPELHTSDPSPENPIARRGPRASPIRPWVRFARLPPLA